MTVFLVVILEVLLTCAQFLPPVIGDVLNASEALALVPNFLNTIDIPASCAQPSEECLLQYDQGINNEDKYMNFTQLATKYGRNVSSHVVYTRDGYCLTLHRLYGSRPGPVLMVHGLFSSSTEWITSYKMSSVAFILNDAGYDVWLGNCRGNTYSRCHRTLSPDADAAKFWNFSWHEIGREDIPAMVDYIILTTGSEKIRYVCHSQGCTAGYVLLSERPEYNLKFSIIISLSALAWMGNTESPLMRLFGYGSPVLNVTAELVGMYEFIPNNPLISALRDALCGSVVQAYTVCAALLSLIGGVDYPQLNCTQLPVQIAHVPSPSATKQVVHFGQLVTSKRFQKYDYGTPLNIVYYGTATPPEYAVEIISTPVVIIWGEGDWLATYVDVNILCQRLGNCIALIKVNFTCFGHLDFIWGKDVDTLIMPTIFDYFSRY